MTQQEAVKFLNEAKAVLNIAISAIKKQEPKKPVKSDRQEIRYALTYDCPTCGKKFTGTGIADYCYHCGQALDWGEGK